MEGGGERGSRGFARDHSCDFSIFFSLLEYSCARGTQKELEQIFLQRDLEFNLFVISFLSLAR